LARAGYHHVAHIARRVPLQSISNTASVSPSILERRDARTVPNSLPVHGAAMSRSHQPVEQCPGEDEAREAVEEATGPELVGTAEVPACVEHRLARCDGGGRNAEGIEEGADQEGAGDVEEEAAVRLET
jgi:hypothetical protein